MTEYKVLIRKRSSRNAPPDGVVLLHHTPSRSDAETHRSSAAAVLKVTNALNGRADEVFVKNLNRTCSCG
jgi:hypothetical protein